MSLHLKSTGIDFADFGHGSGTMTGELLDDYEEGDFNAYWTDGSNDASNVVSKFVIVGRMCQVEITQSEDWDAHGCTGAAKIKGLPFNTLWQGTGGQYMHRYVTDQGYILSMYHGGSTDEIQPHWCRSGTNNLSFTFEHMNSSTAYDNYLGLSYITV